jgi:hypothetical protein
MLGADVNENVPGPSTDKADALEKLAWIEQNSRIYAILYRNAGVGMQFYEGPEAALDGRDETWRQHLVIRSYYKDFQEAVDAEYRRLSAAGEDQ